MIDSIKRRGKMKEMITFYDSITNEKILFEVVDSFDMDGQRYILVADDEDAAVILKEVQMDEEDITYELIENDDEFQKIALLFLESDVGYELEF